MAKHYISIWQCILLKSILIDRTCPSSIFKWLLLAVYLSEWNTIGCCGHSKPAVAPSCHQRRATVSSLRNLSSYWTREETPPPKRVPPNYNAGISNIQCLNVNKWIEDVNKPLLLPKNCSSFNFFTNLLADLQVTG